MSCRLQINLNIISPVRYTIHFTCAVLFYAMLCWYGKSFGEKLNGKESVECMRKIEIYEELINIYECNAYVCSPDGLGNYAA